MGEINITKLDELEANLKLAEEALNASDFDARYHSLMASRDEQYYWKRQYNLTLTQLRSDVDNLEVINETIPRECFNEIVILEPTEN